MRKKNKYGYMHSYTHTLSLKKATGCFDLLKMRVPQLYGAGDKHVAMKHNGSLELYISTAQSQVNSSHYSGTLLAKIQKELINPMLFSECFTDQWVQSQCTSPLNQHSLLRSMK